MTKVDYSEFSDDEILCLIQQNDESAMEYMLAKYKGVVLRRAHSMYLVGGDNDDLIQEGMIGLFKAIQDYDATNGASFYTFAELCVVRQMYNAIKASNRQKNRPLNEYISFYLPAYEDSSDDHEGQPLLDRIMISENSNPEEILVDKESTDMIEYELGKILSPLEKKVYHGFLSGYNYQQLATMLDKPAKSIDNALQRIRTKLTALLQKMQ